MPVKEIYVDSRRRNSEFGNSYVLYIQTPLKNVSRVDLVAATVPNTMYNITNGSNILSVGASNCSIANGFYSASSIVTAINSSLNSNDKLTFLPEEGKFMFYNASSSFTLNVYSTEFMTITGLSSGPVNSQVASPSTGIYSSTYAGVNFVKSSAVANFKTSGEYVYLDIDELRRPFAIDAVSNVYNSQSSTIFAVIPLDVSSGCIKTFKEHTDYKIQVEYPKPIDQIDRLTITWRDFNGNPLNFNGVDENSLLLRFYEDDTTTHKEVQMSSSQEPPLLPKDKKKMVFVVLFISLIFILFIKRR